MFELRAAWFALGVACAAVGCDTTPKYDTRVKHDEVFDPPPQEPRYNNPPESDYKKPAPKEMFRPGPGAIDQGMNGAPVQNGPRK